MRKAEQSKVNSILACIHGQVTEHTTVKWPIVGQSSRFRSHNFAKIIVAVKTPGLYLRAVVVCQCCVEVTHNDNTLMYVKFHS